MRANRPSFRRAALIAAAIFWSLPVPAADRLAAYEPIVGETHVPHAWVAFCTEKPGRSDCVGGPAKPREIVMTTTAWRDLVAINGLVNGAITPMADIDHWGVSDKWSYPEDGYGDCEDYVLLKRRLLLLAGWPRAALLITVVRDKRDDGHAVLTVKTDKGDFVLDNQIDTIMLWSDTGYRFVMRQSQSDPNAWVSLGETPLSTSTGRMW